MNTTRLEAFSDGVIAIIITIMVLEIHVPEAANWESLEHLAPILFGYLLSFAFVGIYWISHHHLLHAAKTVNPGILWANLNLLFWLSLVPVSTAWMNKTNFITFSVVVYAVLLLLCGLSFNILQIAISKSLPNDSAIKEAVKLKGKSLFSILAYTLAIPAAYYNTAISLFLFAIVALAWIVPSKVFEQELGGEN